MAKILEVGSVKSPKEKNGFYWHMVIKKKSLAGKKTSKQNVRCGNGGFDTYEKAHKAAVTFNNLLKTPLEIYQIER